MIVVDDIDTIAESQSEAPESATRSSALGLAVPEPDPAPPDPRPWFKMDGWNHATVDLSEWGQGVVHLADPPYARYCEAEDYRKRDEAQKTLLMGTALLLRGYCRKFSGMVGPAWDSDLNSWLKWLRNLETKPLVVVVDAITVFRDRIQVKDEDAPN